MKYPCKLIRDIMPLYHDKACSRESAMAVEEHMRECAECEEYYKSMASTDFIEDLIFDVQKEFQISNSMKQVKKKMKRRRVLIIGGSVIGGIALAIFIFALRIGLSSLLIQLLTETTRIEVHTDISEYSKYMSGSEAEENYQSKWGMDESIFPAEITPVMNVLDYKMVYYDPWDAQYLGYLVVSYDDADYEKEVERLTRYASTDYLGYYGVTGFSEEYRLLSMFANSYLGFVYALTDDENTIIYVEMIFCNYFMDLDYNKYIPQDYLPLGFDATIDNAYRKEKLGDST